MKRVTKEPDEERRTRPPEGITPYLWELLQKQRLLSIAGAARRAGVTEMAIYGAIQRGSLIALRSWEDGEGRGTALIPEAELERYLRERKPRGSGHHTEKGAGA